MTSLTSWMRVSLLLVISLFIIIGCGGSGSDTEDNTGKTKCDLDEECNQGEVCGEDGYCKVNSGDGDGTIRPDGDSEELDNSTTPQPDGDLESGVAIQVKESVDFGAVPLGSSQKETLSIYSVGTETLRVTAISFPPGAVSELNPEFELKGLPDLPADIKPNGSIAFDIVFTPKSTKEVNITLDIASNAGLNRVLLHSEYKGISKAEFTPPALNFGNVPVDNSTVIKVPFEMCNKGDGNKAISVRSIGLKYDISKSPHFELIIEERPTYENPLFINPEDCIKMEVSYQPKSATLAGELHQNALLIQNDADNLLEGTGKDLVTSEIDITGTSNENSLWVKPSPIQFPRTEIETPEVINLTITNLTGISDLQVISMRLTGNHPSDCTNFELFTGDHSDFPFDFPADSTITDIGVTYNPKTSGIDAGCFFAIETNKDGPAKYSKTPIYGEARTKNNPPVARISRSRNGSDIELPVSIPEDATPAEKRITFFGQISYDDDGDTPLTYLWSLQKPEQSVAKLVPGATDPQATVTFDWPGQYTISLVVTDSTGKESKAKDVIVETSSDERIMIDMSFDGDGEQNVQLVWRDADGGQCSDEDMTAQRTCPSVMKGTAIVSTSTNQAKSGTREAITHKKAPDGNYTIQAIYKDDCEGLRLPYIGCLNSSSSRATIRIYINDDPNPAWTVTESLASAGDMAQWFIAKSGGIWREPTKQ